MRGGTASERSRPRRPMVEVRSLPVRATVTQPVRVGFAKPRRNGLHLGISIGDINRGDPKVALGRSTSPVPATSTRSRSHSLSDSQRFRQSALDSGDNEWPVSSRRMSTTEMNSKELVTQSNADSFGFSQNNALSIGRIDNHEFGGVRGAVSARSDKVRSRSASPGKLSQHDGSETFRSVRSPRSTSLAAEPGPPLLDLAEIDNLRQLLIKAEGDAQKVTVQLGALKDVLFHMQHERFLTTKEWNAVNAIRENCTSNVENFERSSRLLRLAIRERERALQGAARAVEQRDVLAHRVGSTELQLEAARAVSVSKDETINTLEHDMTALNERLATIERLRLHSDEARTRIHRQFHVKSAECERLSTQIRGMRTFVSTSRDEIEKHRKTYEEMSQKLAAEKEQLKKAARAYKAKAIRLQRELESHNEEMQQRDAQIADQRAQLVELRTQCDALQRNDGQSADELTTLRMRCEQLDAELAKRNTEQERTRDEQVEVSKIRAERDTLQERVTHLEARLADLQREIDAVHQRNGDSRIRVVVSDRHDSATATAPNEESRALAKQLESVVSEARRASEQAYDKYAVRERALQQRVIELERLVAALRAETARARYEREQLERRCALESREMRDRLGDAQRASGALQNYVTFLKRVAAQDDDIAEVRAALAADAALPASHETLCRNCRLSR